MNSFKIGIIVISLLCLSGLSAFACSAHSGEDSSAASHDGSKSANS